MKNPQMLNPLIKFLTTSGLLLALSLSFSGKAFSDDKPLQVAWFAALTADHSFWSANLEFAKIVAEDLDIKITPYYAQSDQFRYRELLRESVLGDSKVDAISFTNMKHQDKAVLGIIGTLDTPSASSVGPFNHELVGKPREKFKNWVGQVFMDEMDNGYRLAIELINVAKSAQKDKPIHMFAIGGNQADEVGQRRLAGLNKALSEHPEIVMHNIYHAEKWSAEEALFYTKLALKRYPESSVVWAANDDTALGVIQGAKEMGKTPGKNLFTGGIDGTTSALKKISEGEMHCTFSGLYMHGGWSMILLYDYLHNNDFYAGSQGVINAPSSLINQANADSYLSVFSDDSWTNVDFKLFTKTHAGNGHSYDFSPEALLKAIAETK